MNKQRNITIETMEMNKILYGKNIANTKNMELILSYFLVKLNVNASEELSDEESRIVESELKRLGYM